MVRFLEVVESRTPGDTRMRKCIQCGTCGGSCPSGNDMEHTPRQIFAMVRADMKDEVLSSNTIWYCVSCYLCTSRCPQEIHITDIMYTLKSMAIKNGLVEEITASDLSETFIGYVEYYGRAFELGLATRHNLRHRPLKTIGMASMGFGMLTRGRLDITPNTIKGIAGLRSILKKAKELEAAI